MMGNRRAVFYLVLIFLLGFAAGALGTYHAEQAGWFHAWSKSSSGDKSHHSPLKWLTRKLDLSEEQQEQLEPILDKTGERYYEIFAQVRPEFEQVRQETRAKIRALLTPEQRQKFEELVKEIEEREAKLREKFGPSEKDESPGQEKGGED